MHILFKCLSWLPLWLLQAAGWASGWLAFALSNVYRQRFLDHARQAGVRPSHWAGAVGAAGQMVAELPRLWMGVSPRMRWTNAQCVDDALATGKGVIFLTPHLGCFEATARAYAQRFGVAGYPITVLFRPARKRWLTSLVAVARARPGMQVAPTTLAGVKQLMKALQRGHCVGLLPDQVPPRGQGVWTPFFGRSAYTMTLAARLAAQTGATVLLAWGQRLSWGRGYVVHVQPLPTNLQPDVTQAALQINAAMESLVRQCPQQYLWGYARYKQPRSTP